MEQMTIKNELILDWSRPRLTMAAIGVGQQGTGGNYATVGGRCRRRKKMKKGGWHMWRQQEKRKEVCRVMKMGMLNVGTMTGKGRELADIIQRRKVDVLCVQETRWERKQGEGHWQWLQVVLLWRGWEEKWGRNYIEKRSD